VITILCALLDLYGTDLLELYRTMLHFVRSVCTMLLLDYVIEGRWMECYEEPCFY
jgi:hypothetical protein